MSESSFGDVDARSFHAPFIERMAELGVTQGCGDGTGFCPDQTVSRAQMAVFLTRAFGLPAGADPGFVDVAGDAWYVAAVSSLVASGITQGCGDGTGFCPEQDTIRAHMAIFIHRALNMTPSEKVVRVLYAVPADREFRSDYSEAIRRAMEHVRWWYQQQLDGLTFSLSSPVPEKCQMSQPHDFYARYSWQRVLDGVQHCAPVQGFTSETVWVVYPDVITECSPTGNAGDGMDGYGELGRGGPGLTILGGGDLQGLTEPGDYIYCGEGPYPGPLGRWIGGLAHELGHALGLPHPPGCDEGLPSCDQEAMMQRGYATYPNTYLRDDDKAALRHSPFITPHDPLLQPPAIAGEPGGGEAPGSDPGDWRLWGVFESEDVTTHSTASIEADNPAIKIWVSCEEWAGDPLGKHVNVALVVPMDAGGVAPTIQHRFSTEQPRSHVYRLAYQVGILLTMTTQQVAVRLPAPLLARLDNLVESGAYESRAAVVRAGIEAIAAAEQRRRIDRSIVDGYSRLPPTEAEDHAALVSLSEAILEEPW